LKNQKNNIKIKKTRLERKSGQHDDQAEWAEKRKEREGDVGSAEKKNEKKEKKEKEKEKEKEIKLELAQN